MFLASLDAIEVMLVTFSLSISIDMNDVTLVSEDTYGDDEDERDDVSPVTMFPLCLFWTQKELH